MVKFAIVGILVITLIALGALGVIAASIDASDWDEVGMPHAKNRGGCYRNNVDSQSNVAYEYGCPAFSSNSGSCSGSNEFTCEGQNEQECQQYCEENENENEDCSKGKGNCPGGGGCH